MSSSEKSPFAAPPDAFKIASGSASRRGEPAESVWVKLDGEELIGIRSVNALPPFLMSIVSNSDLWLFVGSNSAFSAGRGDADHAIFPYRTADKILGQTAEGGVRSLFLVDHEDGTALWEPWQSSGLAEDIERNLYKNVLGSTVVFEEINRALGLRFSWRLETSESYGLVRSCTLENLKPDTLRIRYLDGWDHVLPAGVSQELYERFSYLAAAYMRHESSQDLGIFTLNSGITDRAEPSECLRAACAWSLGHPQPTVLLSDTQVDRFRGGLALEPELEVRGRFGAYLAGAAIELSAGQSHEWVTVIDTGLDHSAVVSLRAQLAAPDHLKAALDKDVAATRNGLRRRVAAADGLQQTGERVAGVHHFANVLFNCMRGGTLADSYRAPSADFAAFLRSRNTEVYGQHADWVRQLPGQINLDELRGRAKATGAPQLIRLTREYLPLTFSRRHGDPSRPWNRFSIRTRDESGAIIHDYQGNWRDIFQNWEALAQSYPASLESMLDIFLNASTADGYNPYRITRAGIDWEVENPNDPWSHIGYWGDHQIIYLLRLLESCERFQPGQLARRLNERLFSYALVPYELKPFADLVRDPRHSIRFDAALHQRLQARARELGNDGRLQPDQTGQVRLVSLAEKLLVPALVKLSNLIPGGGIWLNTQRPEWNDANNALAGWGLSVVTVCYLRRYLTFLSQLFGSGEGSVELSSAVAAFVRRLTETLRHADCTDDGSRYEAAEALGKAGEQHRQAVYGGHLEERTTVPLPEVRQLVAAALQVVDATLRANRRPDGLYHSYNLLEVAGRNATVDHLYLMLEGQVAVLSSGLLTPGEALALLKLLRASELFRADQQSYLLYPERGVPSFLSRNTLPRNWPSKVPALAARVAQGARELLVVDQNGDAHFHGDLTSPASLATRLDRLATAESWSQVITQDRAGLLELWETVFHHKAFTGRSGTMFAFEGLGSIYWHMVAKLLVAAQECHQHAVAQGAAPDVAAGLRAAYYDIRRGLGFTKTPEVYGAFPTDPYSHTPRHLGAQQPGMTGQVKEEILTRWGELGVRIIAGALVFAPSLLRRCEFIAEDHEFAYVDVAGVEQTWKLPPASLAFTYCQVPVCCRLAETAALTIERRDHTRETLAGNALPLPDSQQLFARSGEITRLVVAIPRRDVSD